MSLSLQNPDTRDLIIIGIGVGLALSLFFNIFALQLITDVNKNIDKRLDENFKNINDHIKRINDNEIMICKQIKGCDWHD